MQRLLGAHNFVKPNADAHAEFRSAMQQWWLSLTHAETLATAKLVNDSARPRLAHESGMWPLSTSQHPGG